MNADITDSKSLFANHLNQFCEDNGLILSSKDLLPANSFTYVSEAWHTTSWLDRCVATADAHASLSGMNILYDLSTTDHIPFEMELNYQVLPLTENCSNDNRLYLDWNSLTQEDILSYCASTEHLLGNIYLPREAAMCRDSKCKKSEHISAIGCMYNEIINSLINSSNSLVRPRSKKKNKTWVECPRSLILYEGT